MTYKNIPRFFAENENFTGGELALTGGDARHLRSVLRKRAGDRIVVCDGAGADYLCEITNVGRETVTAAIISMSHCGGEPGCRVTLVQSIPKPGKIEYIIQKCVEAGVFAIAPVISDYAQYPIRAQDGGGEKLRERWQKISREASKQSGRGIVPEIREFGGLTETMRKCADMISDSRNDMHAIFSYENEDARTIKSALNAIRQKRACRNAGTPFEIYVFIGPEGGFSPDEARGAKDCGLDVVSLGPRVLRTETAGFMALCCILYEFEIGG